MCLRSLADSSWPQLTLVAVDNGSQDDIRPAVSAAHPGATVIRNATNLGFAGGMNVGLRRAEEIGADYALLLNNDTVVDEDMVRILVEAARDHPRAGMVCPLILYRDRPDTILSVGLRCDLRRGYQGPPIGRGEPDTGQFRTVREVDAPTGAAMLVPLSVVRQVGPLDEALFLYGEDVDWATRMRSAGLAVYVVPRARLWHGLSTSSGGSASPLSAYYQTRNSFVICARHAPLGRGRSLVRAADILFANLYYARRGRNPLTNVRAVLAGCRDYLRGRLGPGPPGVVASVRSSEP
jgi:GT2 family glycosyltransferase